MRASATCPRCSAPGDLLVVNDSATLAARRWPRGAATAQPCESTSPRALPSCRTAGAWSSCAARMALAGPAPAARASGWRWPAARRSSWSRPYASSARLMLARARDRRAAARYLASHGEPIRYGYVQRPLAPGRPTRTSTPRHPAAPRCRARAARSPSSCSWRDSRTAASSWRRSRSTPACPRPSATSRRSRSTTDVPDCTAAHRRPRSGHGAGG